MPELTPETRSELLFLSQDTVANIREIKSRQWRSLALYSATFAFIVIYVDPGITKNPIEILYQLSFSLGTIFSFWLICLHSFKKLIHHRGRLDKIYPKFSKEFSSAHGSVGNKARLDNTEKVILVASGGYIFLLELLMLAHFGTILS